MASVSLALVLSGLGGCPPAAVSGYSYGYTPSYNYAGYSYNYQQQTYAVPYVKEVKFVAVEPAYGADYYASLAGTRIRAEQRAQQQQQLEDRVTKLTQALEQLNGTVTAGLAAPPPAPQPAPTYAPPSYGPSPQGAPPTPQAPPTPEKGSPYPPQLPEKGLPYSAPPPPQGPPPGFHDSGPVPLPGGGAAGEIDAATASVLGKCARCHTGADAKGQFMLFAQPGRLAPLSAPDLFRVLAVVQDQSMPPDRPLGVAESDALRSWIVDQSAPMVASRGR